jgi:hypothetical protein
LIDEASRQTPKSYATWNETTQDEEFEHPESTSKYLRGEGFEVDEELLFAYRDVHRHHTPVALAEIAKRAPWLACLDVAFVNYQSFRPLRVHPEYRGIITFTTPAVARNGKLAFLELWTEDGRYAQMGFWWWLQMRMTDDKWSVEWKHMHALS